MHRLSFRYRHEYTPSSLGIEIPVGLSFAAEEVRILAKVDTGASYCVFQRAHGEALGIEIETGAPLRMTTATGPFLAYGHAVKLTCFAGETDSVVYFAQDPDFPRNILGRVGWLDRYQLALVEHDGLLYLSPHGDPFS